MALSFSSFTTLSLKPFLPMPFFISISCFLFLSNSFSFGVSKSPLPFGPPYSSLQIPLACSVIFKVLSSDLHAFTHASCFFPSIKYDRGKNDAIGPQLLIPFCLSLAVGQGRHAAAKLRFHMYLCLIYSRGGLCKLCVETLL